MEKFNKTITTLKLTPPSPVCNPPAISSQSDNQYKYLVIYIIIT